GAWPRHRCVSRTSVARARSGVRAARKAAPRGRRARRGLRATGAGLRDEQDRCRDRALARSARVRSRPALGRQSDAAHGDHDEDERAEGPGLRSCAGQGDRLLSARLPGAPAARRRQGPLDVEQGALRRPAACARPAALERALGLTCDERNEPEMEMPSFPTPVDDDAEDVVLALETAGALWSNGNPAEALRWLRRAADSAEQAGNDLRAVALAKTAAELTPISESVP